MDVKFYINPIEGKPFRFPIGVELGGTEHRLSLLTARSLSDKLLVALKLGDANINSAKKGTEENPIVLNNINRGGIKIPAPGDTLKAMGKY